MMGSCFTHGWMGVKEFEEVILPSHERFKVVDSPVRWRGARCHCLWRCVSPCSWRTSVLARGYGTFDAIVHSSTEVATPFVVGHSSRRLRTICPLGSLLTWRFSARTRIWVSKCPSLSIMPSGMVLVAGPYHCGHRHQVVLIVGHSVHCLVVLVVGGIHRPLPRACVAGVCNGEWGQVVHR